MNIENRIAALERKFKSNLSKETIKSIPTDWEQFVGLTTIRSGGAMKPFIPYEYQKIISNLMDKYNNIIAVKSRQTGITQMVVSKFLHRAALNAAYSAMAFMRNSEDASAISRRARQMLSGLDAYIKPDNDNVGYLKLRDKGDIYFRNSGKEGCRSYDSVLDFLFDEAAFCPNIQEIYAASSPSGALAGDLITKMIVSTPSAKSGWYWEKLSENNGGLDIEEICKDVADGKLYKDIPGLYYFEDKAGTLKLVIHYSCHPVYNQRKDYLEYRMLQDGTDYETVEREYNLKFIDASVAVFSSDLVRMNATGRYEDFRDKDAIYYAGLDCSTLGDDYTSLSILKYKNGEYSLVRLYRKRKETNEYHLYQIGEVLRIYKPKVIGIEITGGVGAIYLEQLTRSGWNCQEIRTTQESKAVMISLLQLGLEKQILSYPEEKCVLIDELLSFRRDGKKLEAAPNRHDDTVMSTAFGLNVTPFGQKDNSVFDDIQL